MKLMEIAPVMGHCSVHGETEFSPRDPVLLRRECLKCQAQPSEERVKPLTSSRVASVRELEAS